ncbi:TPA: ArsR family transcriptional regulator [Candidatus Peregrinibacteria bacterium]|nr:ArsR family transcriptional regulator [Candidatus Peregrinibacteria bacterium]
MGLTKSEIFTQEQNTISGVAKVLGHPARIAILQYIIESKSCVCGSIVDSVGLAQSTISQHLKELKSIDIIQGDISGTSVCYCLNKKKWEEYKQLFNTLFESGENETNCC